MTELTAEQQQLLAQGNGTFPCLVDPRTHRKYVLVPEEVYTRVQQVLAADDDFVRALTPQTLQIFERDGWDDPAMDIYNDLDPRQSR